MENSYRRIALMTPALAVGLPQLPKPSGRVQPEVSYQWERLSLIAPEMWPLIIEESKETFPEHNTRPPDPDWPRYIEMQLAGNLPIITARVGKKLVGYIVWTIASTLHRKNEKIAISDTHYVIKDYRRGGSITRSMFRQSFDVLRKMGVADIIPHSNEIGLSVRERMAMDRFFAGLGCKPLGVLYHKESR